MAKIKIKNSGMTLIELVVYMSIFSMIFFILMSSVFYIQKIIQSNNQNYYVKNQIYANLNILQQYTHHSHVTISAHAIEIYDKNNARILTQSLENGHLKNTYRHSAFYVAEPITFQDYSFEWINPGKMLKVTASWQDSRGKDQILTEYVIVINQNL